MRKVIVAIALTVAGLVPLVRYQPTAASISTTGAAAAPPQSGSGDGSGTSGSGSGSGSSGSGSSGSSGSGSGASSGGSSQTVKGAEEDTEFGPYQVQATFQGSKITNVQIIQEPYDGHSQRIAREAAPMLLQEALQAQSAKIDTISGATATSEAYAQSLQSAIDAHNKGQ